MLLQVGLRAALPALLLPVALYGHLPSMSVSGRYFNFVAAPGGASPSDQFLLIGTNEHPYQWSAAVATTGGGNWLRVSPPGGSLFGNFETMTVRMSVNSTGLGAGVYRGTITFEAVADNAPLVVEVALTIDASGQPAPGFAVSPSSMALEGGRGSGRTWSQSVQVRNAGGGVLNFAASAATETGGNWLSVTPASGVNNSTLTVAAAVGDLSTGTYAGRILLSASGAANSPRTIPVSLRVREPLPAALVLSSSALDFVAQQDSPNPPPQSLAVSNGGDGALNWRAAASTFNGGPWLAVSPAVGSGPGSVAVSVDFSSLAPGTYAGRVLVTADGALGSPAPVAVTLTVRRPEPIFLRSGVVNGATFFDTPLAPGEILTILGSRLGPVEGMALTVDPNTQRLPVQAGGTRVTFDGVPAPLFFVRGDQINLQVPFEVAGRGSTQVVVNAEGLNPAQITLPVVEADPGIFTMDGTRAAALNQDFTLNSPENPATVGSVVQLFVNGQGALDIRVPTGALAPVAPPFPKPVLPVHVSVDAVQARVWFAGAAPGLVGVMQINAEIPRGIVPSDNVRVTVGVGFQPAAKPAMIAVR